MTVKTKGRVSNQNERSARGTAKADIKESFAYLIEGELERAEVLIAAKAVTADLQDIAEKLSKVEADSIMPMLDSLRDHFGQQSADQYSQVATGKIRELIGSIQAGKSAIDAEISRMETVMNGGDPSDAAMSAEVPPAAPAPVAPGPGAPPDVGSPMGTQPAGAPEEIAGMPVDPAAGNAEDDALGATGFAGRPAKESRAPRKGRTIMEANAAEDINFKDNFEKLAICAPGCVSLAHKIKDSIHDLAVSGEMRNKLTHALSHMISMCDAPEAFDDPESSAEMAMTTHFADGPIGEVVKTPEISNIMKLMRELAHMIKFHHAGHINEQEPALPPPVNPPLVAPSPIPPAPISTPVLPSRAMESHQVRRNIERLKEARNPDKLILEVFRRVYGQCGNVTNAVMGTARAFSIDAADVAAVVREAKARRKVAEEAMPALMGVAMGQANFGGNTAKPTAASPVPGKPRKPMTPGELRAAKHSNVQNMVAPGENGTEDAHTPTGAARPPVSVQTVKPVEKQSPQEQQQARALAAKNAAAPKATPY